MNRLKLNVTEESFSRLRTLSIKKILIKLTAIAHKAKYVSSFFKTYFNKNYSEFLEFLANQVSTNTCSFDYDFINSFNMTLDGQAHEYYPADNSYYPNLSSHIINNVDNRNNSNSSSKYYLDYISQKTIYHVVKTGHYPDLSIYSLINSVYRERANNGYKTSELRAPNAMRIFTNALYNSAYYKEEYTSASVYDTGHLVKHTFGIKKYLSDIPYYEDKNKDDGGYNIAIFDLNSIYYILKSLRHSKSKSQIKRMINNQIFTDQEYERNDNIYGDLIAFCVFGITTIPSFICYWLTGSLVLSFIVLLIVWLI